MARLPNYVLDMLKKREKLGYDLIHISSCIDEYCRKIGVEVGETSATATDVRIYCEPSTAFTVTRDAIKECLSKEGVSSDR